jgi:LysM repeat protein
MNTPNPLIPQGTLPESRGKSHVRIAVFTILAIHVLLLGALLMAGGCKKTADQNAGITNTPPDSVAGVPPFAGDTNTPVGAPNNATGTAALAPAPVPAPLPVNPPSNVGIPTPPPSTPTTDNVGGEHTIVKGDTLGAVAKKYHVSLKAIQDANPGVVSSKLKIGQKIKVPAPTASVGNSGTDSTSIAGGNGETTVTVKSGDTLWGLAKKYGVKEAAIRSANNLKTGALKVGQKLKIPAKGNGTPAPGTPDTTPSPLPVTPSSPAPAPAAAAQ